MQSANYIGGEEEQNGGVKVKKEEQINEESVNKDGRKGMKPINYKKSFYDSHRGRGEIK